MATIITYVFQRIFSFPKSVLKIQIDCIEYLKRFYLYVHSAKLIKFCNYQEIKTLYKVNI